MRTNLDKAGFYYNYRPVLSTHDLSWGNTNATNRIRDINWPETRIMLFRIRGGFSSFWVRIIGVILIIFSVEMILMSFHTIQTVSEGSHGNHRADYVDERIRFGNKLLYLWKRNTTAFWNFIDGLVNNEHLYPKELDVTIVTDILKTAKIEHVDLFKERNSLKWLIMLEGGQKILFKPRTVEKFAGHKYKMCNHGCEQPEYEIAGYTISRMLGYQNFPFVVGRNLNWTTDIVPVASQSVKDSMVIRNGSLCVRETNCLSDQKTFCYQDGIIPGAMIYFIRRKVREILEADGRDYNMYYPKPDWEEKPKDFMLKLPGDDSFCKTFHQMEQYKTDTMYGFVLDSTIISYLTNHRDQKMMRAKNESGLSLPIMFDFGFAFCDLSNYNLILAAPVYQCCHIRQKTYQHLLEMKEDFYRTFFKLTRTDPLYPVLRQDYVDDVKKRVDMLLALVNYCITLKGYDNVVRDSFQILE